MFGRDRSGRQGVRARERLAFRRLFEAAATDAAPAAAPPYFAARVRARARSAATAPEAVHPVGVAAWRMLPLFGVVALAVASLAGYESLQLGREREAAVTRMLTTEGGGGDLLVAALLLGQQTDTTGGAP
jgi:hypothetical protein